MSVIGACLSWVSIGYGVRRGLGKALAVGFLAAFPAGAVLAEPLELLALGDSLTQGYGLNQGEGLVPQLQTWLVAQGADVVVTNAGVSGDTTAGGRARLAWSLTPGVDAVMIELGGNDMLRGQPPAQARENLAAMLAEVRAKGLPVLLVGLQAPGNYGAQYQADFNAIWPELAAEFGAVVLPDLFAPISARPSGDRAAEALMQADGIHPSAKGVALLVEGLGPKVLEVLGRVPPANQ